MDNHPISLSSQAVVSSYMLLLHGNVYERSYRQAVISAETARDMLNRHLAILEQQAKSYREQAKMKAEKNLHLKAVGK